MNMADTPCQLPGRGAKYGPGQGQGIKGIRGNPLRLGAPKGGAPQAKKRGGTSIRSQAKPKEIKLIGLQSLRK